MFSFGAIAIATATGMIQASWARNTTTSMRTPHEIDSLLKNSA